MSVATIEEQRLAAAGPGLLAALSFGIIDILSKVAFGAGASPVTIVMLRSVFGVVAIFPWLRLAPPAYPHSPRGRHVSLALGVLYAGNTFGIFRALQLVPVPIAVLTYFVYPLLTGLAGAAMGSEKLGWRGAAATLVSFLGLALMIGAHSAPLAFAGIAWALFGAVCRAALLLITRSELAGFDSRLTTWYSFISSAIVLIALSVLTHAWGLPTSAPGLLAVAGICVLGIIALQGVFTSAARIGAFRTALLLNFEPVISTVLSIVLLGELLTPAQLLGGAAMVAALCAFQIWR